MSARRDLLGAPQPGRRLVEQEHLRLLAEGPGDCEQAELAERQRPRGGVSPVREADELESVVRLLLDLPLLSALPGHAKHRLDEPCSRPPMAADHGVPEDVEVLERTGRLEDGAETRLGAAVGRPARDVPPSTTTAPASTRSRPEMHPRRVDLPAPFGPIRHVSEPRSMPTSTSSTAATAPNDLRDAADLACEARGAVGVGRLDYRRNAAPNRALGLHWTILPAHMLSIWIPLWFLGPKYSAAARSREPAELRLERAVDARAGESSSLHRGLQGEQRRRCVHMEDREGLADRTLHDLRTSADRIATWELLRHDSEETVHERPVDVGTRCLEELRREVPAR